MAMPGDLKTEPDEKVIFNAPFVSQQNMNVRLTNCGETAIGWMFKCTDVRRFTVTPTCGALDPDEQAILEVICEPFDYQRNLLRLTCEDRMTIEWTDAPSNSAQFSKGWFQSTGVVRRKVMAIEYNF